jgi:streptomycin 6-kinase
VSPADHERRDWVAALPGRVAALAAEWKLDVSEPYEPGGRAAWVARATRHDGEAVVLKLGWRHFEAEHEAGALRLWDGEGAIRCLASRSFDDATALLLERCEPGEPLGSHLPEEEQDVVIAGLFRRLWARRTPDDAPFRPLESLCAYWADRLERRLEMVGGRRDLGLARDGLSVFRELPASANQRVLLCTDLHAENVLSARREPWLVIDPKPFLGDPAFDPVQHMLNCERLARDAGRLADTLADLLDLEAERVRLWLFARCAQEGIDEPAMWAAARSLAP